MKRAFFIGLAIVAIETLVFALLVFGGRPQPSVAIGLIVIAPLLFLVNVVIGLYFYFRSSKQLATVVFINSIVSPVIFYFVWTSWFGASYAKNYTQYSFRSGSNKFQIIISKNGNDFSIADITDQHNGTATERYYGKYQVKGDSILMASFEYRMIIFNEMLFNFPQDSSAIDLQLIE